MIGYHTEPERAPVACHIESPQKHRAGVVGTYDGNNEMSQKYEAAQLATAGYYRNQSREHVAEEYNGQDSGIGSMPIHVAAQAAVDSAGDAMDDVDLEIDPVASCSEQIRIRQT